MARSILPIVVGTAGHIDHGKSSLVKALTGIDPDRLPEEKARGLSIDLGFARWRLADGRWVGIIDVPGHERFVRNMVAGCTSIDLALLVVAADDGVMPQTIEHLEILDLLGIRGGLIALTKIDVVDAAIADLAAEEVRELVRGTPLDGAGIVRVSSKTGEGIPELARQLAALVTATPPRSVQGPFRMPIQRVFSMPGIGTVITGVPLSGSIGAGREIEVLPKGGCFRVRELHAYGGKVDEAAAGHSTALAVPEARDAGLRRGMVACEPGTATAADAVDVDLQLTARAGRVAHREPVRLHVGTAEAQGHLLLLDRDRAGAGDRLVARIELDEDVCCAHGDRFLLRRQSPVVTLGGGRVLRLARARRVRRASLSEELAGVLAAGDQPQARLRHALRQAGPAGCPVGELAQVLGVSDAAVVDLLAGMPDVVWHARGRRAFRSDDVDAGERELLAAVAAILARRTAAASVQRTAIRTTRTLPEPLRECVFDRLAARGETRSGHAGRVLFVNRLAPLPPAEQDALERIVAECERRGQQPPATAELAAAVGLQGDALASLLARAQDEGRVVAVGGCWYGIGAVRAAMHAIRDNCLANQEVLDIPALRDLLGTTRKYLIPLLEHVDALGLTVLRGGVRRLLPSSAAARDLAAERASGGA